MEKQLKSARNLVNKIVKNLKRNDLDWTVQVTVNSVHPDKVSYCAQIAAPAEGLQALTWIKDSWEELLDALATAEKGLDPVAVDRAWHEAEIQRAEALINYHKEALAEKDES